MPRPQTSVITNVAGTAGQPDAAVWREGPYILLGGFWGQAFDRPPFQIYLPLLVRNA